MPKQLRKITISKVADEWLERYSNPKAWSYGELKILQTWDNMNNEERIFKEFGTKRMPLGKYLHTSISHPTHYPTWDEIKEIKELLHGDRFVFQVLPPKSHYVNAMPTCFHLWELPQ